MAKVSTNPLAVEFPTDEMGLMIDTKGAVLALGDRIANSETKLKLALATIEILGKHLVARHKDEVETVKAEAAERAAREEAEAAALAADMAATKAARVAALEEALEAAKAE